jgi:type VI secretion system secreted protein VgrG
MGNRTTFEINDETFKTDQPTLQNWHRHEQLVPNQVSHRDYNFENPSNTYTQQQSANKQPAYPGEPREIYNYPGNYKNFDHGQKKVDYQFDAIQALATQYTGTSQWVEFVGGHSILVLPESDLEPGSDQYNAQIPNRFFLKKITHSACDYTQLVKDDDENNGANGSYYQNHFTCISTESQYRPLQQTPKPKTYGTQTAIVAGRRPNTKLDTHLDQYGRVYVHFPWDRRQDNSCWVRVAHSFSGAGFGTAFHPRLGQEVLVQFEHGDPDRPIIIGSLHNKDNMPPYDPEKYPGRSGIKTRSMDGGSPDEYNELYFEDEKGKEEIYLKAQKDMTRVVENNDTTIVNQGDHSITVEKGSSTVSASKSVNIDTSSGASVFIDETGAHITGGKL